MSDHYLKFKGPGFHIDAKGWLGIAAAVIIVVLVALPWLWHLTIS